MSQFDKTWKIYADKYDPIEIGSIDGTDTEPHDRALLRAMHADYKPNRRVRGNPHHTIFVGRLNPRTTQETIETEFSKFGAIVNARLVKDIVTGKSRGYAFVEYDSAVEARNAVINMKAEVIDNSEVLVDMEAERVLSGWKPRRLGGGFGGKKESGQLRFGCRDRPFKKPIHVTGNLH